MKTIQPSEIAKTGVGVDLGDKSGSFSAMSALLHSSEKTGGAGQRQMELVNRLTPPSEADVLAHIAQIREKLQAAGESKPAE